MKILTEFIDDCGLDIFLNLMRSGNAQHVITSCILSRYSNAEQNILRIASAIGEDFHCNILSRVLPPSLSSVMPQVMPMLIKDGIIQHSHDGYYTFPSSVIRGFIYNVIPPRYGTHLVNFCS